MNAKLCWVNPEKKFRKPFLGVIFYLKNKFPHFEPVLYRFLCLRPEPRRRNGRLCPLTGSTYYWKGYFLSLVQYFLPTVPLLAKSFESACSRVFPEKSELTEPKKNEEELEPFKNWNNYSWLFSILFENFSLIEKISTDYLPITWKNLFSEIHFCEEKVSTWSFSKTNFDESELQNRVNTSFGAGWAILDWFEESIVVFQTDFQNFTTKFFLKVKFDVLVGHSSLSPNMIDNQLPKVNISSLGSNSNLFLHKVTNRQCRGDNGIILFTFAINME